MVFNRIWIIPAMLIILICTPNYTVANGNLKIKGNEFIKLDSILQFNNGKAEDLIGKKYYKKYQTLKRKADLDSANAYFIKSFKKFTGDFQNNYALELARLFVTNKEEFWLVKDWYLYAISSSKVPSVKHVEELLKKYKIVEELVKHYGRTYGNCDDALELLQDYKGDLDYYYIQVYPSEIRYKALMDHLKIEERFLIFDCNIK